MPDRLDSRIRAFVVELVDQPVEAPPFPADALVTEKPRVTLRRPPGWARAALVFAAVLIAGFVSILLLQPGREPIVDTTPEQVVAGLTDSINAGDLEATLAWFADDAQCIAPGLPGCEDLLGFFISAQAELVFTECSVLNEPYLQCFGYLHTSVHDALGITVNDLADMPNFPPAFIVEAGEIKQLNFSSPFTGDGALDDRLWAYLIASEAGFINEEGVPLFSADIVPDFEEAARQFVIEEQGQ